MVPALLDVFTCQGFFKRQALLDLLTEMAGELFQCSRFGFTSSAVRNTVEPLRPQHFVLLL
jgi:hypothetical protein